MDWLKKLLEAAVIRDGKLDVDAFMTAFNTEFPKNAVPKDVYNTLLGVKAKLEKDLIDRDGQLEILKKVDAVGLQAEITRLQDENKLAKEKYDSDMLELKKNTAIDLFIKDQKGKNVKAIKALVDLSKVSMDGDNLLGIKEQLDTLKTSDGYLFETTSGGGVGGGTNPPGAGGSTIPNPWKKETFNLTKQAELLRTNPALATKYKAEVGK